MDPKRIVMLVVGASVMVLIFSAILVPIINDATETEKTFTNDGYARYSTIESTDSDTITFAWDHSNPSIVTVGTETVDLSSFDVSASLIFGENWTIRYTKFSDDSVIVQYLGPTASDFIQAGTSAGTDLSVTLENGTLTVVSGTTTKTLSYTSAYCVGNSGDMVLKKSTQSAYLLKDSSIVIANGLTTVSGNSIGIYFDGTVNDGYEVNVYRTTDDYSVSNIESDYSENAAYLGLVELSKITFDVTPDGGTATEATYTYFLVPYQVTAELTVHPDGATLSMLSVIPIIVMIGIILAVVGVAIVGRNDY